jgi:hypothetical protein
MKMTTGMSWITPPRKLVPWGLIPGSGDILTSEDFAGIHFNIWNRAKVSQYWRPWTLMHYVMLYKEYACNMPNTVGENMQYYMKNKMQNVLTKCCIIRFICKICRKICKMICRTICKYYAEEYVQYPKYVRWYVEKYATKYGINMQNNMHNMQNKMDNMQKKLKKDCNMPHKMQNIMISKTCNLKIRDSKCHLQNMYFPLCWLFQVGSTTVGRMNVSTWSMYCCDM